jgi:hypothetical protein
MTACVIRARSFPLCHDLRGAEPAPESPCSAPSREGEDLMSVFDQTSLSEQDACIAMSIDQLFDAFYEQMAALENDDGDDERRDAARRVHYIAAEIFERSDVRAVRRELVRTYTRGRRPDEIEDGDLEDLRVALDAVERRQAARLLRDTLGGEKDA